MRSRQRNARYPCYPYPSVFKKTTPPASARGYLSLFKNALVQDLVNHKSMKKIISIGLLLLLILLPLTSCNSNRKDVTIITLSGWQSSPAEKQRLEDLLRKFEASHPHVKVKYEVITDQYMDVIKTRLIGDAAPDIFYLDALEAPLFMGYEVLEPLDPYITPEFNLADFEPSLLKAFQSNGKTYGIPKDFSTLALFYNPEYFAAANITEPPQTWEEFEQISQTLTVDQNQDGRRDRYGFGIVPELARQYFVIKAFGGELMNQKGNAIFANAESLKGLQKVIDQYRQSQTAAQASDVGASSISEMFGQGKAAMVFDGTWAIPYLNETFPRLPFATAEVPTMNGKKGTMAYTVAYVMNKKAKNKAIAWELIAYLTGETGMKAWARGGLVLPARRSILTELGYNLNPLYAPFIAGAEYATIWQAGENLPVIMTHFNNQFISALLGQQSLRSALRKAQNTANKEIQLSNY